MNQKLLNRIIAFFVFLISAVQFFVTAQPTLSFWDCGEFAASSYSLQVPHPPGTPFFLLVGKLFSMIPFAEDIGFRINTVSILSSAFSVLFLYLIIVKVIQFYHKKELSTVAEGLKIYLPAAIGALSLSFSDTFWFNGVESEVYAFSTFFIALVVWLMILWNEKADEPESERYLILIFYLIGLSTGVHLMSVLAIVSVVMTVYFRKYLQNEETLKQTGILFLIHAGIILVVAVLMWLSQTDAAPPSPEDFKAIDRRFLMIFALISIVYMGVFYKKIFVKDSIYIPLAAGGVTLIAVYPGLVKYFTKIISIIGSNNTTLGLIALFVIIGAIIYLIYWTSKENKYTSNLILKCLLFAILGVTTYAQIMIRANQEPPINMNSPKTFTELESYLNREQYGEFPIWKRRYSSEPHQMGVFTNYSSDFDFLWNYQMNHMFNRYLFWNYIGRVSNDQDAGVDFTQLLGIPFLLGLFGLYHHYRRDWKMASIFLVMFIFLGYLTAFYQNQQEPQPRERDYFYVGAFFVFSMWIGLGVRGLIELLEENFAGQNLLKPITWGVIAVSFFAVPVNMAKQEWFWHDRSKNYVPWDYAYNMLQSVAPNAILFTNGDNDTFPLWYLQDVQGVRRDVRIANLSLLNTNWYIKQLKNNQPYGTAKIDMSFTDEEIDQLSPVRWEPQEVSIPVSDETIKEFGITDSSVIKNKRLTWVMQPGAQFGDLQAVRVQDLVVLDIIGKSQWKRPVYFAVTVSDDSKISLDDYLIMEGMAWRVIPKKNNNRNVEYVNEPVLRKQLMEEPEGYNKLYQPGFKFRGLNDSTIFFDENHIRLVQNYRNAYIRLSLHYLYQEKNNNKVTETLDMMEKKVPRKVIPMDYRIKHDVAKLYFNAGAMKQYNAFAKEVIEEAKKRLNSNPRDYNSWYNPYDILLTHYDNLKMYNEGLEIAQKLKQLVPNDENINELVEHFRNLAITGKDEVTKQKIEIK
ncbi:MAG: DUF2723 domain-containing protein [Melioribacteraceae bacterium]|nr:DUF2723 domain-containing protein [Melioribacteraceae bacterium]